MAEAYDYMKESGYAAAYLRLRGAAVRLAGRFGAGRLGEIAAGAPDVIYTLVMLLRDGRVPQKAKVKLGIAAAYFAMPLDVLAVRRAGRRVRGPHRPGRCDGRRGEGLLCEYWPGDIAGPPALQGPYGLAQREVRARAPSAAWRAPCWSGK